MFVSLQNDNPDFSFTTRLSRSVVLKKYGNKFFKVIYEKSSDKRKIFGAEDRF